MTMTAPQPEAARGEAKLLPCPFCGSEAHVVEGNDGESAYVQCTGAKFHRALWLDGDNNAANDVCEAWNRRARAPTGDGEGGKLADMGADELRASSRKLTTYADIYSGDKEARKMSRRCWDTAALLDAATQLRQPPQPTGDVGEFGDELSSAERTHVEACRKHFDVGAEIRSLSGQRMLLAIIDRLASGLANANSRASRMEKALRSLAEAEQAYRMCHDLDGDGASNTGRAWDTMRAAGQNARAALSTTEAGGK